MGKYNNQNWRTQTLGLNAIGPLLQEIKYEFQEFLASYLSIYFDKGYLLI